MAKERDESHEFKVVDRRPFSDDGSRRPESPAPNGQAASEVRPIQAKPAPATPADQRGPVPADDRGRDLESEEAGLRGEGLASFETLVSYLSTTAMFQLGLIPGPGGEAIPTDFVNARRTVDLLEILQEKTRGNLTRDEARMLEDVLYELRITFVEVQNHLTRKGQ